MVAAGSNSNLTAVSMAVPVSNGATKMASNGNKNQNITQGQTQTQQQGPAQGQPQGQVQVSGTPTMVAGKPAMLPPQSAAPLVLGQIGNVFSQAGSVTPTFVTQSVLQSKGQSLAMPLQAQPQLINSQAPIRLSQPLVTNTGQIITSQPMLANPAFLQALANLQQQVWGVTPAGQVVPPAMLDNSAALQGAPNTQGIPLATHQPLLGGQGQSQTFLAGQSLYIRPMQPAQQISSMMPTSMQAFPTLKGNKVQLEPNMPQPPQQQQQQQQQQAQGQQIKAVAIAGTGLGKTILPSTSRTTVTAKIQPSVSGSMQPSGPRLNIPSIVPKQKSRGRSSSKVSTAAVTSASTVPVTSASSAVSISTTPAKVAAVLTSSPSMPTTPVAPPAPVVSAPAPSASVTLTSGPKSQSDSEVEMGKKHGAISDTSTLTTSTAPSPAPVKDPVTVPPVLPKPRPMLEVACKAPPPPAVSQEPCAEEKGEEEDMEVIEEKAVVVPGDSVSVLAPSVPTTAVPSLPSYFEKQRAIVKPHILTHIIDGFVIQEGPEPFPVQRSSLLLEFVPPKPSRSEKESEDDATEYDEEPPPLLNKSEAHFSGSAETDLRKCEYCGKSRIATKFRNSGRFCSMACAKRYNVACSRRVGRFHKGSAAGKFVAKKKHALSMKKGWRTGRGGRLAYNINMKPVSNEMSSSNSGQETSSSAASPPPQQDFDVEMEAAKSDPAKWSVMEVYEFVKSLPGCQEYADEFRQQEIDGQALLLLKEDHLMTAMSIKLGPALKICARINSLRDDALSSANTASSV